MWSYEFVAEQTEDARWVIDRWRLDTITGDRIVPLATKPGRVRGRLCSGGFRYASSIRTQNDH